MKIERVIVRGSIFILMLFGFCNTMQAQVQYGIKGGLNTSTILYPNRSNDYLLGYQFGLTSEFGINGKFFISPGLMFETKGGSGSKNNIQFDYITFPVLIGFYPFKKLSIGVGPQLGYLVNTSGLSNELATIFRKVEMGVTGNIEYKLMKKLSICLAVEYGLNGIYKAQQSDGYGNEWTFPEADNPNNLSFLYSVKYMIF